MPAIAHQNKILGNTSGGGSTILVTTSESTLYGQTVSLTDGVTTLNATFSNSGSATFSGVTMTGNLTVSASYGGQTAQRTISVPYFGNYSTSLSFFTATITVTFPASEGATCTLDGTTASTSPYAFTVSSAGTYTASCTLDGVTKQGTAKVITTDGQTETDTIEYGTINVTYDNAFRGTSITCVQSGTTITKTAPSGANTMTFYPPTTGNWVISGTVSGTSYSKTANVTSLSTSVSVSLETVPDGKTTTPTDDIEKWLQCGQITGKSYTTLSQVLADAETYERLLSDSNACDYMARSTTWASTICADADAMMRLGKYDYACDALFADSTWCTAICGSTYFEYVLDVKVPVMTSATTPSGEVTASSVYSSSYPAWRAFDQNFTTSGWHPASPYTNEWVQYEFQTAVKIRRVDVGCWGNTPATTTKFTWQLLGSNDGSTFTDINPTFVMDSHEQRQFVSHIISASQAYDYYRVTLDSMDGSPALEGIKFQFYGRHTAQTDIIVTAHGGDTVYYMENGSPVTLTTADSDTGIGTVDWSDLPKGAITLYSSTAKNPSDLTADYSKTVYVTEYTTQIYLMPDNALYWYGYESSDLEDCTSVNGWSYSGYSLNAPTHNTTSIRCSGTTSILQGVGTKYALQATSGVTELVAIGQGVTLYNNTASGISWQKSKNLSVGNAGTADFSTTSLAKIECTSNYTGNVYGIAMTGWATRAFDLNALYAE